MVKQKLATIFKMDFRQALTSYNTDASQGIFGGEEHVMKTLEETKKQREFVKSTLLTTKKAGKMDKKSGKNIGKKPAAGGTKAKGKGKGKVAKMKAGSKTKPRPPPTTTRKRRSLPLRGRTTMNNVSFLLIF